jgi:hypothetical protein
MIKNTWSYCGNVESFSLVLPTAEVPPTLGSELQAAVDMRYALTAQTMTRLDIRNTGDFLPPQTDGFGEALGAALRAFAGARNGPAPAPVVRDTKPR